MQWIVVVVYVVLLVAPTLAPLPMRLSHIYSDVVVFAQFAFWGVWWPFVLVSMVLVGRSWCGLFCPEGAMAEAASRIGLGRATPHWMKWRGWPFVAFACTTIYGQMVSVYQYPKPVLIVLGGSTLAAIGVGLVYGRNKRAWCRYLCPVNGVFALLSKLSPLHYRVDRGAWADWRREPGAHTPVVSCAPLVPIKTMQGVSACHMCGRCAGYKDAIALELRSPAQEIVEVAGRESSSWETALIVFGLIGLAAGAFQWTSSPWYVDAKQAAAEWIIERGWTGLVEPVLPWFVLTNYPDQNDMMTPLDGALMIFYVCATTLFVGVLVYGALWLATRALGRFDARRFHHLAQTLIPVAGCGVFLGLSATTVTLLRAEGLALNFVNAARGLLLAGASLWTGWLAWRVSGRYSEGLVRRVGSTAIMAAATGVAIANWILLFWIW